MLKAQDPRDTVGPQGKGHSLNSTTAYYSGVASIPTYIPPRSPEITVSMGFDTFVTRGLRRFGRYAKAHYLYQPYVQPYNYDAWAGVPPAEGC